MTVAVAGHASASSIVYVKDANVWIANPDGSGQYQVTRDGSTANPYLHASQSDNGTIAASRGQKDVVVLKQNGDVVSSFTRTTQPLDPAISPDGNLIAFSDQKLSCGLSYFCYAVRVVTPTGDLRRTVGDGAQPAWIDNVRLASAYNNIIDWHRTDLDSLALWFGSSDISTTSSLVADVDVAPNLSRVAYVENNGAQLFFPAMAGDPPAKPVGNCSISTPNGGIFDGPSFSPDGAELSWAEGSGIYRASFGTPDASGCPALQRQLIIPGGADPDWGPANVNPGARSTTPTPVTPSPGTDPIPGGAAVALKVGLTAPKSITLTALRAKGLSVQTSVTAACRGAVVLGIAKADAIRLKIGRDATIVAQAGPNALAAGSFSVTLRLKPKYAAKLKGARRLNAILVSTCVVGSDTPVVKASKIVLKG